MVRIEVDAAKVDDQFEKTSNDFVRHASLPGFRPGKAPRDMVLKKHEKDIQEEVKKHLLSESYRAAIKEHKLNVAGYPDVEEIQFGRGQSFQFAVTIETEPEFQLPEIPGIAGQT